MCEKVLGIIGGVSKAALVTQYKDIHRGRYPATIRASVSCLPEMFDVLYREGATRRIRPRFVFDNKD